MGLARRLKATARRTAAAAPLAVVGCTALGFGALAVHTTASAAVSSSGKAQLIARADTICRRVNTQTAPFQAQVTRLASAKHPNYRAMAAALNGGIAVEQRGLSQLRALPVPVADRATATKIWNELGTVVSASQAISDGVAKQNITAVNRATQRKSGAEAVYRRLAKRFGLKYCGN
jgi:hypothetical protein